jgi:hypothetical protein
MERSSRCEGSTSYGAHVPPQSVLEHAVQVDGVFVNVRQCGYCWAEYLEPKAHRSYFCSAECSRRNSVWNSWVRDTNHAATHGDVNRPARGVAKLPPAGKSLEQVSRFGRLFELEQVA